MLYVRRPFIHFLLYIYYCCCCRYEHSIAYAFIVQDRKAFYKISSSSLHFFGRQLQQKQRRLRSLSSLYEPNKQKLPSCLYDSMISDIASSFHVPSAEEFNYGIQNIASQLASVSMKDINKGDGSTTTYITSLPYMYCAGLLTSISPCVWGLLPLTMSYISQAAGERSDHKTVIPTIVFAAGLATVFCSLGFMAVQLGGIFGSSNSVSSSSSIVLSTLSYGVCFIMGFQLLDFITLRFPSSRGNPLLGTLTSAWNRMINENSNESPAKRNKHHENLESMIFLDATGRMMTYEEMKSRSNDDQSNDITVQNIDTTTRTKTNERGSLIRTFLLGGSSALVASPCATPVLTSILAYVADSATNPFMGAILLFIYTMGYATPLLIVSATGGQALENLRRRKNNDAGESNNPYARIGPWVTPITGGILLWYGTDGILHTFIGDPSIAGLNIYA